MTHIASKVIGVTVRLADGQTIDFAGIAGTVTRDSSPIPKTSPSVKAWTDGSAPRTSHVTVTLVERDDS